MSRLMLVAETKAVPGANPVAPTAPPATDPAAVQAAMDDPTHIVDPLASQHQWAGDVYEEGDETGPEDAFASFTGPGGEEAWLDRAADGTLTGWVRDAQGTVFLYTDADTWAIDVDDASMSRADTSTEEADEPAPDDETSEADTNPPTATGTREVDPQNPHKNPRPFEGKSVRRLVVRRLDGDAGPKA